MKERDMVVVDIETTGLSKHHDRITEIAAIKLRGDVVIEEFHSLVNPEMRIPGFITRLTGIDDELVKEAPTIKEVIPKFDSFLGESVIVAHNATFDHGFLSENHFRHLGSHICNDTLCTRKLSNRLLKDLPSKKLSVLCEHFGISNERAHRAMADTKATVELFLNLVRMLERFGFSSYYDVKKIEKMSPAKFSRIIND